MKQNTIYSGFILLLLLFMNFSVTKDKDEANLMTFKKQKGAIQSIAFSPDGNKLISGSDDQSIVIWDIKTGEATVTETKHVRAVVSLSYTPDGMNFISGGDKSLKLWSSSGEYLKNIGSHSTDIWSLSISPDSRSVASGSYGKTFDLWDINTAKIIHTFEGHERSVLAVCISPNGKYLASGSLDETIILWDLQTKEQIRRLKGHYGNIYDIDFTPDSKYFISASRDKTLRLWNVEQENSIKTFKGHRQPVSCVDISPNGKLFLSGSYDNTIRLWEATTGKTIYTYIDHDDFINDVSYSPDGKTFVSASSDKSIILWKVDPRIFVDVYFVEDMMTEMNSTNLFQSKKKSESKTDYNERKAKADKFQQELYDKYYNKYLKMIEAQSIEDK